MTAKNVYDEKDPVGSSLKLRRLLDKYAQTIRPWADETAKKMVLDVTRRDEKFWAEQSRNMAGALREEIKSTPIGAVLRQRTREAAALITSLPLEAAQRVERLAVRQLSGGARAGELAREIMRTGHVTESRANLIARTETSRTASLLQQTRAEYVGSEGYIWRTAGDADVREVHRRLAGKFFRWDSPPVAGENGERSHPGGIYNCRCWAEIVLPGEERRRFAAEAA